MPEAGKVIVVGLLLVHPLKLVTLVPPLLQPPETVKETEVGVVGGVGAVVA